MYLPLLVEMLPCKNKHCLFTEASRLSTKVSKPGFVTDGIVGDAKMQVG